MVFLALSMVQGVFVYFEFPSKSLINPATSKFLHNLSSVLCFVIGMVSLIYGYRYGTTHDLFESVITERVMIGITIFTTVLTLIGAVKSEIQFLKNVFNKNPK